MKKERETVSRRDVVSLKRERKKVNERERKRKRKRKRERERGRSEEHTSELQSRLHLVCRLLLGAHV